MKTQNNTSKFQFFSHGMAQESIIVCNFKETLSDLYNQTFESLYTFIREINLDYYDNQYALERFDPCQMDELDISHRYCGLTGSIAFKEYFKKALTMQHRPIVESFISAYRFAEDTHPPCDNLEKYKVKNKVQCKREMESFLDLCVTMIERYIMHQMINQSKGSCIVVFDTFKQEYMYALDKKVSGIIAKHFFNEKNIDYRFLSLFDIPIMKCDQSFEKNDYVAFSSYHDQLLINPSQHELQALHANSNQIDETLETFDVDKGKIKLYAPFVDDRFLDQINKSTCYDGYGLFRTEYTHKTFGMMPSDRRFVDTFKKMYEMIKSSNKEFMIRLPDIRPEKQIGYMGDLTTDLDNLYQYPRIFFNAIEHIAEAFGTYEHLVVVLPMIMSSKEVTEWVDVIKDTFDKFARPMPKIGVMISTEAAYDYIEDYAKVPMDIAIIGLNDLFEDMLDLNPHTPMTLKEFNNECKEHIQHLHQVLRELNIRHIFSGNMLRYKDIFHKFIKMGCREFCVPIEHIKDSMELIKAHVENQGKYVGMLYQQRALTEMRRQILQETGVKPKNRYPKTRKKPKKPSENA